MYKNKKIFVFGLARSGYEVSKLLSQYNNDITVLDSSDNDIEKIKEIESLGIKFIKTDIPEDYLDSTYDYLIKNPGIINTHPCIEKAKSLNIDVINEVEVAYHFIKDKVSIIENTRKRIETYGKETTKERPLFDHPAAGDLHWRADFFCI